MEYWAWLRPIILPWIWNAVCLIFPFSGVAYVVVVVACLGFVTCRIPNNVLCVFVFLILIFLLTWKKKEINGIPLPSVATQDGFVPVLMTW